MYHRPIDTFLPYNEAMILRAVYSVRQLLVRMLNVAFLR